MMDEANHHTNKPVLIGEILKDGQFKVVWRSRGWSNQNPGANTPTPKKDAIGSSIREPIRKPDGEQSLRRRQ